MLGWEPSSEQFNLRLSMLRVKDVSCAINKLNSSNILKFLKKKMKRKLIFFLKNLDRWLSRRRTQAAVSHLSGSHESYADSFPYADGPGT
jgi:glucan phosphoethanolaminetransferase (alkaline phosphatase superfamily)